MTHAGPDGSFVDPASEKLFNAVAARVEERETQLTQQSPDGLPVKLSTAEVDKIFEEVKFYCFTNISSFSYFFILIYLIILIYLYMFFI